MKKLAPMAIVAAFAAAVAEAPALAKDYTIGALKISAPWTRVTPPGASVAGGFLTITNTGTEADRLTGGTAVIAKRLELHEMSMHGGIMKMRALEQGVEIPAGATVTLQPGSTHIMFMDLTASPAVGMPVKGSLQFEKAGPIEIEYDVAPLGAKSPTGDAAGTKDGPHDHH